MYQAIHEGDCIAADSIAEGLEARELVGDIVNKVSSGLLTLENVLVST